MFYKLQIIVAATTFEVMHGNTQFLEVPPPKLSRL